MSHARYDLVVIGSGPAGQKAAIQGAKAGRSVAIVEQSAAVGGECVHHGTIPSKTLRETAVALAIFRQRSGDVLHVAMPEDVTITSLLTRLSTVVHGHERYIADQLQRNGIDRFHGRARFLGPHVVEVQPVRGEPLLLEAATIVIAVGSVPRTPPNVPVDHEAILDSDSILSLLYLPRSLTVLGSGVVACEYASIFAGLGVAVTVVDRFPQPLGFLDPELTSRYVAELGRMGGTFIGEATIAEVTTDGLSVTTRLADGRTVTTDKMLCAQGRVAPLERLDLAAAGLAPNARGLLDVDAHCRTAVPHVYAVGDVIGPPALATSAMEQGRRAVRHALGLEAGGGFDTVPVGIYTIPEMACVGISETEARKRHGEVTVGRARFDEIARGHVANCREGFLKMVADGRGERLLGVQIIGEGATELIHLAQMALVTGASVEIFVDNVFNFPTLAEAYRVAALDVVGKRAERDEQPTAAAAG